MQNENGNPMMRFFTSKGFTYILYLLLLIVILYVGAYTFPKYVPKYEATNKANHNKEVTTEDSDYRKYDYGTDELQLIITNRKGERKIVDMPFIYEKIGQPEKLYVEISRNDIP